MERPRRDPGGVHRRLRDARDRPRARPEDRGDAGVDTYTVTVHATVLPAAYTEGTDRSCYPDAQEPNGGFLNTVVLTVNGVPKDADACSEPELPTVAKVGIGAAVQNPGDPDVWTVAYRITVSPSGFDTFYSIEDTPAFPVGAVISPTGTAQLVDVNDEPIGSPLTITSGVDFPGGPFALGADETQYWIVTWDATIAGGITPPGDIRRGDGFRTRASSTAWRSSRAKTPSMMAKRASR